MLGSSAASVFFPGSAYAVILRWLCPLSFNDWTRSWYLSVDLPTRTGPGAGTSVWTSPLGLDQEPDWTRSWYLSVDLPTRTGPGAGTSVCPSSPLGLDQELVPQCAPPPH
ncbi:unnamed protein product [Boreogadus saida]